MNWRADAAAKKALQDVLAHAQPIGHFFVAGHSAQGVEHVLKFALDLCGLQFVHGEPRGGAGREKRFGNVAKAIFAGLLCKPCRRSDRPPPKSPTTTPPYHPNSLTPPASQAKVVAGRLAARSPMPKIVAFDTVSQDGLESSPVAAALAGLRANEARYFHTKYQRTFAVSPAAEVPHLIDYVSHILQAERGLVIAARPLEATQFEVEGVRWTHVFYESGLAINVLYTLADPKKRAVGFKLSQGMEVPAELASKFKFARQKSKLAGEIRGSFFVIKGQYP